MGDCSKYRILQMAVIRDNNFLTSAFISLWGSCASSRHSILRLWRGPSSRAYSLGIISHGLSFRCGELCLFKALHPAPLARPFSKGLLAGDYLTWVSFRCGELCLFKALHPAPLARPFSKGLLAGDYLTWAFMPLRRIVPLRGTPSCALVRLSLPPRIVIPSVAEGSLLQSSSSPALLIRLHETPYPTFLAYQASRFRSHAYSISP